MQRRNKLLVAMMSLSLLLQKNWNYFVRKLFALQWDYLPELI
jgi:hypothetical protein